jgi:hypothetical protein
LLLFADARSAEKFCGYLSRCNRLQMTSDWQAEPGRVTRRFIDLASMLLTCAMAPLLLGIVVEVYLIAKVILNDMAGSMGIAAGAFALLAGLWFVWPRFARS